MKNFPYPRIILLLLTFSILSHLSGQVAKTYERGEIMLNSSEIRKGYIWIVDQTDGDKRIYFKPNPDFMPTEYSAFDIISLKLEKDKRTFVSESIPTMDGPMRRLMELHFKGKYSLLSYNGTEQVIYFLLDESGGVTELVNSFIIPDRTNMYTVEYNREYREILRELFNNDPGMNKLIDQTEFNEQSISRLLQKYHIMNHLEYTLYPEPLISVYLGGGGTIAGMKSLSYISSEFSTFAPFAGFNISAILGFFNDMLELGFESSVLFGSIYYDINYELFPQTIGYYEDISKVTFLAGGINLGLNPQIGKKLRLYGGASFTFNNFIGYDRDVVEEVFFVADNLVISNYYENLSKPDAFLGVSGRGSLTYEINGNNSVRLAYSFGKRQSMHLPGDNSDAGIQSYHTLSITYLRKIF